MEEAEDGGLDGSKEYRGLACGGDVLVGVVS